MSRWLIVRRVAGIFFPQRPVLKIDAHGYSPTILHRVVHMAGVTSSFDVAEAALSVVGEISISDRQINKLTAEFGGEMAAERDRRRQQYVEQSLPRHRTVAEVPIDLAAVFHRMQSQSFEKDPQPDLPDCFCRQAYVEKLVHGLKRLKNEAREDQAEQEQRSPSGAAMEKTSAEESPPWQPKTLFRTCLSSLATSEDFGVMMAADADRRGFLEAGKKAFLGDGLSYNWSIQRRWFPGFVPITDFVKQVSKRVKGTEKSWNDGPSGEAILQVRAAVISDGDPLQKWIVDRPVSPFSPRCRPADHRRLAITNVFLRPSDPFRSVSGEGWRAARFRGRLS